MGTSGSMSGTPPEPWASAMVEAGLVDPRRRQNVPSMGQLAERAGIAVETVRRMVKGIGEPEPHNVESVADALKVPAAQVIDWVYQAKEYLGPYRPPPEADLLGQHEREAVNRVIVLLAESKKAARRSAPYRRHQEALFPDPDLDIAAHSPGDGEPRRSRRQDRRDVP